MKKLICLICLLAALCLCALATAETLDLADTGYTVELPDCMAEYELSEKDVENGIVQVFKNEDETMEMDVAAYEPEFSYDEIREEFENDEEIEAATGFTTINGIEALYIAFTVDDVNCICYYIIDDEAELDITFYFIDDEGGTLSGEIMSTLRK